MLQILLTILKILLWIFLSILGLVIVLLLLVLFAPIKYKVDAKKYETIKVRAKINFLIASITVLFDQETNQLDNVVRICGIPLKLDGSEKKDKPKKEKKSKKQKDIVEETIEDSSIENTTEDTSIQSVDVATETSEAQTEDTLESDKFDVFEDTNELPKEEKHLLGRIKVLFKKIWEKLIKVKDFLINLNPDTVSEFINKKTCKLRKTIHRFKIFWNMKCTIKTRTYLKKYLVSVLKHIAPRKVKGSIKFGFDEPYKTGQIIGYISMLPFVYQKELYWEPDFYNKVIEGELYLKGKIRLGYIARIVLNINIWKTIKAARKIKV